jgi:succinylarginine dihydrolase
MVKKLAYPRGVVPPQLRPYVEAIRGIKNKGGE